MKPPAHVLNAVDAEVARLPPAVAKAFRALGDAQRLGAPEKAMLRAQFALGGGVLSSSIEHVGDLTHRMTEYAGEERDYAGYEPVREKVERVLGYLQRDMYGGFTREHHQNMKNNAEYRREKKGTPEGLYYQNVERRLSEYAAEHAQLPVYNEAQCFAREAAVSLGKSKFADAEHNLARLQQHLGSRENWTKYANQYSLDESGQPKLYKCP